MFQRIPSFALGIALGLTISVPGASAATTSVLSQTPLFVSDAAPPMNMLVVAKDHKLFAPAYNDASDIDEDGVLDIYYKPSIDYTGYFDSYKCYSHDGSMFVPVATTSDKTCSGQSSARWSGDYLNYLTMSRIDVLRKVLYGGYRYTDTTSDTVLERVFIPNDAHTWGKEYLSVTRDGYNISDYTPISAPTNGKYVLFANTSRPSSGTSTIYSYTNGALPKLRIVLSDGQGSNSYRIWGWVSREVSQGTNTITNTNRTDNTLSTNGTPRLAYDLTVRVKTCVSGLLESNCTQYGSTYKPTGLLHDYGASDKMYFGLMTGTYTNNLQGGALRKAPTTSFTDEYTASSGRFLSNDTSSNNNSNRTYVNSSGIVATLDRLTYTDTCSSAWSSTFNNSDCLDWGNPLGEMTYETLRYFAGKSSANSNYASGSKDTSLGLTQATWSNPYSSSNIKSCAAPFMTLVSDVNPSYDSDIPGSSLGTSARPNDDLGFNFTTIGDNLWNREFSGSKSINIGQSGSTNDSAPTAKTASSFASIRGLPEEATRQGSYSTPAVTYFGSQNSISASGSHPVQSFSVALSSTLPNIQIKSGSNTVVFKPYGMVADTSGIVMQLTGFYMDTMANTTDLNQDSTINGGRPYYKFRVVYDDAGQNADYDMDSIVLYTVQLNSSGNVSITSETDYSVSGSESHMGYTIAGTTKDGIYLEVTGGVGGTSGASTATPKQFKFDTPSGKWAGECNNNGSYSSSCSSLRLPGRSGGNQALTAGTSTTRVFTPSGNTSITTLENPMWYAAKYGKSDLTTWDTNSDSTPDNYFLVSNPAKLQSQLRTAFDDILQLNSSVTSPTVSTEAAQDNSTSDTTYTYTTSFSATDWTGDLKKTNIATSEVVWRAASRLSSSGRNIYFGDANGETASFIWNNLSTAQKALLNRNTAGTVDSQGEARVNFIRGSNTSFRSRSSLLGDIVNSSPLLVTGADYDTARANNLEGSNSNYGSFKSSQDRSVIYVGANDGMLHAFDADTGDELFAFVPKAVIANLPALTASDYGEEDGTEHQYFVDGSPVARDVYFGDSWHKVLLGSLGAGGREVFALDITDPESPELLWEFTNEDDADMGYSVPKPNIARLHNGKWVALIPNGYESGNSLKAVLFVVDIETGELLSKLEATPTLNTGESATSLGNGLSRITDSDFNGDGIADYAYAGDLLGNLWRFDLINTGASNPLATDATADDDDFAVSFGGEPLYVARDAQGTRQAITAAPTLLKHPTATGYLAIFGTGRYLSNTDKTSDSQQSLYAIWDRKTAGESSSSSLTMSKSRASLVEQEITQTTLNGSTVFNVSDNAITWYDEDGTADSNVSNWGWYVDFIQTGERLIYNMSLYGNTLVLSTITPDDNACSAGMTGTIYGLNPRTGGATRYNTFDIDGDGTYDAYAGFVNDGGDFSLSDGKVYFNDNDSGSGTDSKELNAGVSEGRQTWRQLTTEEE